jgi:hypothetical protein
MAGKGDKPRPIQVNQETYDSNWDRIFNKDKKKEKQTVNDKGSK